MKKALFLAALLILSHFETAAAGTPSDMDLLGELDETPQIAEKERGVLNQLHENAEYKLISRTMTYYRKAKPPRETMDNASFVAEGRLEFKTSVKLDQDLWGLAAWADVGSQDDTYSQRNYRFGADRTESGDERKRRYFELNEIYRTHSWEKVDLTLGKKKFEMGLAPLYSPANRIMPADLNDPLNPKEQGLWQAALDLYQGSTTYTYALFPFFIPSKLPSQRSRWASSQGSLSQIPADFQFFNVDPSLLGLGTGNSLTEDYPSWGDALQNLLRAKTTFKGWDFFMAAFNGIAAYPVLRKGDTVNGESALVREYIKATTLSFGYSTTYRKFEFHGEGLFQWSHYHKDEDYFSYVAGTTYTIESLANKIGLEKIELTLDYAGEAVLDDQNADGYEGNSGTVRAGQRDILLRLLCKYNQDFSFGFAMNINMDDEGGTYSPGIEYKIREGLVLKVNSEFFYGPPDDSSYGRWKRNNRLITTLEYSF